MILKWSCEEGCDCKEKGHIHYDDPRFDDTDKKEWWKDLLKR